MSTKESGSQIELASEETGMMPHWKVREIRSDERLKVIENSMSIKVKGSQIELASEETGIKNHLKTRAIL